MNIDVLKAPPSLGEVNNYFDSLKKDKKNLIKELLILSFAIIAVYCTSQFLVVGRYPDGVINFIRIAYVFMFINIVENTRYFSAEMNR